jgi:hypothetical protein
MASRVSAQTPTFKVKVAELFKERHPDGILPEGKVSEEAATMGRLWQKKYNEPSPRIRHHPPISWWDKKGANAPRVTDTLPTARSMLRCIHPFASI